MIQSSLPFAPIPGTASWSPSGGSPSPAPPPADLGTPAADSVRFEVTGDFVQNKGVIEGTRMVVEAKGTTPPQGPVAWRTAPHWDRVVCEEVRFRSGFSVVQDCASDSLTIRHDGQIVAGPLPQTHMNLPFDRLEPIGPDGLSIPQRTCLFNGQMMENVLPQGVIVVTWDDREHASHDGSYPRYRYQMDAAGSVQAQESLVEPCMLPDGSEGEHSRVVGPLSAHETPEGNIRTSFGDGRVLEVYPFVTRPMLEPR